MFMVGHSFVLSSMFNMSASQGTSYFSAGVDIVPAEQDPHAYLNLAPSIAYAGRHDPIEIWLVCEISIGELEAYNGLTGVTMLQKAATTGGASGCSAVLYSLIIGFP